METEERERRRTDDTDGGTRRLPLRPAWQKEWDAGISELKPRSSRHDGYVVGEPFPWPSRGSLVAYDFLSQPEPAQPSPTTGNEKRETEETERLYGTVVATTQLLVQSWGGARTHTAPLSWGRKEGQNTS